MAHLLDLLDLKAGLLGELLERRFTAEPDRQLALDASNLARALGYMHGQTDGAPGVLKASLDGLSDPQGGVG